MAACSLLKYGSISPLYSYASSGQPYTELFRDLSSVWCTCTDTGSSCVRLLSQHTRCLVALPGLPSLEVVAKFLYMFLLIKHLLSSKKGGCQKDMKWSIFFLLQIQHFIEYPTLSFFHEYFNVAYKQLYVFFFKLSLFDLQSSVSSPPEMHYKRSITQAKTAQGYSEISTSLIVGGNYRSLSTYQKSQ